MKKTLANTMLSIGASLSIIAVYLFIRGVNDIPLVSVFQIIGANIMINFGLFIRSKFEIRNIIIEFIADVSYIIAVLVILGVIFNWYKVVPVWLLIAMAVAIYVFVIITNVVKINKDADKINELLQKRREKDDNIAT